MSERTLWAGIVVMTLALAGGAARAKDAYYEVRLEHLTLTAGQLPAEATDAELSARWRNEQTPMWSSVQLHAPGEAYLDRTSHGHRQRRPDWVLFVRAEEGQDVRGRLHLPKPDWTSLQSASFEIKADQARPNARQGFLAARHQHYDRLVSAGVPGGAWFRHQRDLAQVDLWRAVPEAPRRPAARRDQLQDTFSFFTGSRAISENLQLDRMLDVGNTSDQPTVPVSRIRGITVREIDWKPMLKGAVPEIDPLSSAIPADQHVVFFPTFDAFLKMIDEADTQGTPVLQLAEARSEDAASLKRYQRQLGLPLTTMGRLIGRGTILSVAVTGSDPYVRVGSDVAVLFQTDQPDALLRLMQTQVAAGMHAAPGAKTTDGDIGGTPYRATVSPDRRLSSYTMATGGFVVVANSFEQLKRVLAVSKGQSPAIASLDEYRFFRDRYKLRDGDETALLLITDATIRRWCSPRWRIADSRRTRVAGVLADLQARHLRDLASSSIKPGPLSSPYSEAGQLSLTPRGVTSAEHGSLEFMTPIVELPMDRVSAEEARAYEQWRTEYERIWTRFFDPIAVRFGVEKSRLSADVTVLPVPLRQLDQWGIVRMLTEGGHIKPGSGAPPGAAAGLSIGVPRDLLRSFLTIGVIEMFQGWLGDSVTVYVEDDPYWKEAAAAGAEGHAALQEFVNKNRHRLPLVVRLEATDAAKVAEFARKQFRELIDPYAEEHRRTIVEERKHRDRTYYRHSAKPGAPGTWLIANDQVLYQAALPDAWVATVSEEMIRRAIDRSIDGPARPAPDIKPDGRGPNLRAEVKPDFAHAAAHVFERDYQDAMRWRAFANIPILNEWKRLYPDRDPVELHERLWHTRLLCPGGGEYQWNDAAGTMESTVYGNPAAPKSGPAMPAALQSLLDGTFELSFEPNDGIRARAVLRRK